MRKKTRNTISFVSRHGMVNYGNWMDEKQDQSTTAHLQLKHSKRCEYNLSDGDS
jgi:hypothetical protein